MQRVLLLKKKIGETPLETVQKFKENNPEYQDQKLGYAGRLDPMAEGLLLVLVGKECKKRKEYESLLKTYEFEILFGISTDTFDVMGKIVKLNPEIKITEKQLEKVSIGFVGKHFQKYPPYSSPRVKGKPLFWWARKNRLNEIDIPKKRIQIYSLQFISLRNISSEKLLKKVHKRIKIVKGDFRQREILEIWDKNIKNKDLEFQIAKLKIECSSGTYVRSIADEIGKKLKIPSLALSINRRKIGNFIINYY
ncbi:MAG: hypothetical protein V1697_00685 [Candidatus Levyibacteriota bacterium]